MFVIDMEDENDLIENILVYSMVGISILLFILYAIKI